MRIEEAFMERIAHRQMLSALVAGCLVAIVAVSNAQPVVLQEEARVTMPEGYGYASDVCIYSDDLLVLAKRANDDIHRDGAWVLIQFHRVDAARWAFVNETAAVPYNSNEDIWRDTDLECDGPLGAFSTPTGPSYAVEHTMSGWRATALTGLDAGSDTSVLRDTLAIAGSWRGPTTVALARKNATGQWADIEYAVGNPGSREDFPEIVGPYGAWLGAAEIAATGDDYNPPGTNEDVSDLQVFDLVNGVWRVTTLPLGHEVEVVEDRISLRATPWAEPGEIGAYLARDDSGEWTIRSSFLSEEAIGFWGVRVVGERAYTGVVRNAGEVGVFQREAPRRYRHVATLSPSDFADRATGFLADYSVHGERVAAVYQTEFGGPFHPGGIVYVFRAPTTIPMPQQLQRTFEDNSTADWSFTGDADWRIVSAGGTRMLRQSKTTGVARAVLEPSEGDDQSIQADVRINELGPGTPWAGFVLRYTDSQNYYYLLVNRSSVQIRKIANGSYSRIATAPLNLVLGRWYNFRLEAIGSRLRMFVNGAKVGEVIDYTHAQGRAGMTMWRARTDYDNVIVTSGPQTELFTDTFNTPTERPWTTIAPANAWSIATLSNGERVYRQNLISGGARAVNGGETGDQIIRVNVRPTAFNSAADGWVGVMTRYVDNFNNYFVMLHKSGRASVRKRVNGVYTRLEEVPFTVTPNTTYRVRIEAIGASLRVYVNERLLAEGVDEDLTSGRYGLVTWNAKADFDNFTAVRP
jgi:hypothetical protein